MLLYLQNEDLNIFKIENVIPQINRGYIYSKFIINNLHYRKGGQITPTKDHNDIYFKLKEKNLIPYTGELVTNVREIEFKILKILAKEMMKNRQFIVTNSRLIEYLTKELALDEDQAEEYLFDILTNNTILVRKISYTLTKKSVNELEKLDDISDDVISKLKQLIGREVRGDKFFYKLLNETIGNSQFQKYRSYILKHSEKNNQFAEFLHPTMQEYLTAAQYVEEDINELFSYIEDPWWNEVIKFAMILDSEKNGYFICKIIDKYHTLKDENKSILKAFFLNEFSLLNFDKADDMHENLFYKDDKKIKKYKNIRKKIIEKFEDYLSSNDDIIFKCILEKLKYQDITIEPENNTFEVNKEKTLKLVLKTKLPVRSIKLKLENEMIFFPEGNVRYENLLQNITKIVRFKIKANTKKKYIIDCIINGFIHSKFTISAN